MALLDDLGDILTTGGTGTLGTDIFKGFVPSTPDALVAIFQTGGGPAAHAMGKGPGTALVERPHVQVLARAARADDAEFAAKSAGRLLDAYQGTVNGVRYLSIYPLQAPFFLRRDEINRVEYVQNFEIQRVGGSSS